MPLEQPLYLLPQVKKRALIPQLGTLIVLAAIFYAGILLNISLLQLRGSQETVIKTVSLIGIIIIAGIGTIIAIRRAHLPHRFYQNRLTIMNRPVYYSEITSTSPYQSILDKLFRTYTIPLNHKATIRNIPLSIPLQPYLQQMIDYARQKPEPGFNRI